jgi:hypothetical protein
MFADDLTAEEVLEAVINAPAVTKVLRSTSLRRASRHDKLFVIVGTTYEGLLVYTKGAVREIAGEQVYYFFVSSKRWRPRLEGFDED